MLGRQGLAEKSRVAELKALEDTFIEGARKTYNDMGRQFNEKAWRKQFRGYANSVYRIRHQKMMERRNALQHLRAMRKAQRAEGIRPMPWRDKGAIPLRQKKPK